MLKLIVFLKCGDSLKVVVFVILTKSLLSSLDELNIFIYFFLKKEKKKNQFFTPWKLLTAV